MGVVQILTAQTITTTGGLSFRDDDARDMTLFWNISSVSGGAALVLTIAEVDLVDETTVVGQSSSSSSIMASGVGSITITGAKGALFRASWAVSGPTPTIDIGLVAVGKNSPLSSTAIGSGSPPVYVAPGETFTVPRYEQALVAMAIDCDGVLILDGVLLEVA